MNQQSERLVRLESTIADLKEKLHIMDRNKRQVVMENEDLLEENNMKFAALEKA